MHIHPIHIYYSYKISRLLFSVLLSWSIPPQNPLIYLTHAIACKVPAFPWQVYTICPITFVAMYVRLPILQRYVCQISTLRDGDLGGDWMGGIWRDWEGDPLGDHVSLGEKRETWTFRSGMWRSELRWWVCFLLAIKIEIYINWVNVGACRIYCSPTVTVRCSRSLN